MSTKSTKITFSKNSKNKKGKEIVPIKTLRGGKGRIDYNSTYDIALLRQPGTRPRAIPLQAPSLEHGNLVPRVLKRTDAEILQKEPRPTTAADSTSTLGSEDSTPSIPTANDPGSPPATARFVYEEYVYGQKGKGETGATYTYKEEYERPHRHRRHHKRRLTTTASGNVKPLNKVKSRYMDYQYKQPPPITKPRSYIGTSRMLQIEREGDLMFTLRMLKLKDEIRKELNAITGKDSVELLERAADRLTQHTDDTLDPYYFPKRRLSSPVKRVYNAGVSGLAQPKTLNEKIKYEKHDNSNKHMYYKIKRAESKYRRDKMIREYQQFKTLLPEGRFPNAVAKALALVDGMKETIMSKEELASQPTAGPSRKTGNLTSTAPKEPHQAHHLPSLKNLDGPPMSIESKLAHAKRVMQKMGKEMD